MPRPPRRQRLTFFLLKPGRAPLDVVRDADSLDAHHVDGVGIEGPNLFIRPTRQGQPRWVALLRPHTLGGLEGLRTASSSAVLLVAATDRLFAMTFGYGRHLIEPDAVVHDFGLKVVLNTVAYDQIKSVDARSIDELTLHTRRDVSRDSSFGAFGLDVSTDLVRAVTGTTSREGIAGRLTGADSLALNSPAQVPELPQIAERLLGHYGEEGYLEHFDFIDHLRAVKDPGKVADLDDALIHALRSRSIDNLHLAVPETLPWVDVPGFRFSSEPRTEARDPDSDPRISVYLETREVDELSLDLLRRDRVQALSADDQVLDDWPVYRCIVFEQERDGQLYTLSAGQWYRVGAQFKDDVYEFVTGLPRLDLDLPNAESGQHEQEYVETAGNATGALVLDRRLATESVPTRIEICDLLTQEGQLIHIKKRGASSTLSHLFSQGLVSAEMILQDEAFRREARRIAAEVDPAFAEALPAGPPSRDAIEVAYVVITRSTGDRRRQSPLTLPFFSLVNLRAAAQRLRNLGFRVSVAEVSEA